MRSKIVWRLNTDKTIIEVQKGTSKLYANGAASVEYGLVCDFLTDEDVVVIVANREGNQYSQRLKRGLITYNDGTTEMGWKVISNGAELNFDLESGSAQIGFSFDIKRISQLDQVSVLEEYTSSTDNVEVYPSSKYYPQLDPSDEEMILHDIAVIEARLNRGDLEAKGIKQWIRTFEGSTDPSGYYQGANIGDYYYNYAGDNLFVLERVVAMGQYWTKLEDSGTRGYNTNVVVYHAGTKTFYKSLTDNNIDYIPSANWQKLEVQDIIDLFAMIGDLEELTTTNKDNLVNAINEVDERSKGSEEDIADLEERVSQNEDDIADLQTNKQDKLDNSLQTTSKVVVGAINELIGDISASGHKIQLQIDSSTYIMTLNLLDKNNNIISSGTIDLPLESVVVDGRYDAQNKKIVLTLKNGTEISFSVADLISGLQTEITENNKLSSDLVDDTNKTNKFITSSEKQKIDIIETTGDGDKYLSNDGTYKLVSGSVEVDNETIKKDQNNKLKAVALKDEDDNVITIEDIIAMSGLEIRSV